MQPGQWMELPNTKIRSVLPNPVPQGYAPHIITAWGGGTVDTARNRMIVWGGGHADYWGNEVYALELSNLTIKRIVDPSPLTSQANCDSALPDGTPVSRHTYDGLAYIAHADRMLGIGGSMAPCGYLDKATWAYDFTANKWNMMTSTSPVSTHGAIAVYDPVSKLSYIKDQNSFWSYSLETNQYTKLGDMFVDYHVTAAIDTKRRKFVMIGDGVQVIDLATNRMSTMSTSNAPGFVTSRGAPGIAYDPVADRIVAWHGGGSVYALNMDTGAWTQVATNAGPPAAASTGTYGRWGFVPQYGVFALVNDIDQNAWVFKLR
jgi:hypothetical protein